MEFDHCLCRAPCRKYADTYRKNDVLSIQESIVNHVEYTLARTRHQFDDFECYQAAAYSLRDRLIEMWNDTQTYFKCAPRRCCCFCCNAHLLCRVCGRSCSLSAGV